MKIVSYLFFVLVISLVGLNYTVDIVKISISTEKALNFAPTSYKSGFIFSSRINNYSSSKLYFSEILEKELVSEPVLIETDSDLYNIGNGDYCNLTSEFYFVSNSPKPSKQGLKKIAIFKGEIKDFKLANVERLKFNDKEHHYASPTLSEDGLRMIISSDKEELNNMDLYEYERQSFTKPWKLKRKLKEINSSQNDLFPNFVNDSTLIFSSLRDNGKGGLDFYLSEYKDGLWSEPENFEYLNSDKDDLGFLKLNEDSGYFSSNRGNDKDAIYFFESN